MLAQEPLHSPSLMKPTIIKATRSENVGDPRSVEPVIGSEQHHVWALAPTFLLDRGQAQRERANRGCLFVFDANSRAPQNALDHMRSAQIVQ